MTRLVCGGSRGVTATGSSREEIFRVVVSFSSKDGYLVVDPKRSSTRGTGSRAKRYRVTDVSSIPGTGCVLGLRTAKHRATGSKVLGHLGFFRGFPTRLCIRGTRKAGSLGRPGIRRDRKRRIPQLPCTRSRASPPVSSRCEQRFRRGGHRPVASCVALADVSLPPGA
jgi:hypothetical protein